MYLMCFAVGFFLDENLFCCVFLFYCSTFAIIVFKHLQQLPNTRALLSFTLFSCSFAVTQEPT